MDIGGFGGRPGGLRVWSENGESFLEKMMKNEGSGIGSRVLKILVRVGGISSRA